MFSALACVAFAFSGFASCDLNYTKEINLLNEPFFKLDFFKPCKVYIYVTTPDGKTDWIVGDGGDLNWDGCGEYKDKFIGEQQKNKLIKFDTEKDVTVIWG